MTTAAKTEKVAIPDAVWFRANIPCQEACPVHTDVSGYIGLIVQGRFDEACALNRQANLFPDLLGRVRTRLCEGACRWGRLDQPVAICHLKRAAADLAASPPPPRPAISREERVAIIGAGPTGLAAAHDLSLLGYPVTIYEALAEVGGMLVVGIPAYRLPRSVTQGMASQLRALGVEFRLGTPIGQEIRLEDLRRDYAAVVIAAGAHKPERLDIPGEDLEGVLHGVTFMRLVNTDPPDLSGRRVAVVGGGHTAIDCVRSAVRLGAAAVHLLYRRTTAEMTITPEELEEAQQEGVMAHFLVSPKEVHSSEGKTVSGLECLRNRLGAPDASGRPRPELIPGAEFIVEVDLVIPAVSQAPDISFLPSEAGLEISRWDRLVVDPETFQSSVPGVFALGDFITGPRNVIEVIADGRKAASVIHRWLSGEAPPSPEAGLDSLGTRFLREEGYDKLPRQPMPTLPPQRRRSLEEEVELGFTRERAIAEARRCLQCQLNIAIDGERCILCAGCVEVCPYGLIRLLPLSQLDGGEGLTESASPASPTGEPMALTLDEELCVRCGLCVVRCPTRAISMTRFSLRDPAQRWHVGRWRDGNPVPYSFPNRA